MCYSLQLIVLIWLALFKQEFNSHNGRYERLQSTLIRQFIIAIRTPCSEEPVSNLPSFGSHSYIHIYSYSCKFPQQKLKMCLEGGRSLTIFRHSNVPMNLHLSLRHGA